MQSTAAELKKAEDALDMVPSFADYTIMDLGGLC